MEESQETQREQGRRRGRTVVYTRERGQSSAELGAEKGNGRTERQGIRREKQG